MPDHIRDGTGKANLAKVGDDNRLWTDAISNSAQHIAAHADQDAFQVIGTTTPAAATVVVLHGKNNHPTKDLVLTYVRHQVVDQSGGTAFPNASNYFRMALDRTYASDGASAVPVQLTAGNGKTSQTTWYTSTPTLVGTAREFDRFYTKAEGDMNTFNKEGTVIVPPNGTIEFSYVGDHTSGTIYCRVSFYMEEHH